MKYLSRKFILTLIELGLISSLPVVYVKMGVTEMVTMTVLALLGGIGAAYGFINVKDAANEAKAALPSSQKDAA